MSETTPERVIDPICDMTVVVVEAKARGLTLEHDGRTFAFCSKACHAKFAADPARWAAKTVAAAAVPDANAVIDEGMRRWYESCRCCMHDAHPELVAAMDAERTRSKQLVSGPGICEVAEGKVPTQ